MSNWIVPILTAAKCEAAIVSYRKVAPRTTSKDEELSFLADVFDLIPATEHVQLWKYLSKSVSQLVESLEDSIVLNEDVDVPRDQLNGHIQQCNDSLSFLIRLTKLISLYMDKNQSSADASSSNVSAQMPSTRPNKHQESTKQHMLACLLSLHDILIPLNNNHPSIVGVQELKLNIAKLCEKQYLSSCSNNLSDADGLVTQLLPYLLLISLSPGAVDADVKRIYSLRSALELFDFDDESIESMRGLLLRCFIQPSFLKLPEGKKFLAEVLNIQSGQDTMVSTISMLELALEVIKPQVTNGSRTVCLAYGEILLRAWKESDEGRDRLEEALQSFVKEAIHCADRTQFRGFRLVLSVFHDLKREEDVDSLLNRMYGPFLWRSLKCANAIIRSQASTFFFDVFPLQDPDLNTEAAEHNLQFQFESLTSLLQDNDHRVRTVAASGACAILREYWEAMPPHETRKILAYLINTLCSDASSAAVRQAAIQGLATLLDQPLAHAVLKKLLPHLSNSIHDDAEKVRLAFVEMLCKVKNIRDMHFYEIVPVPHILQRLAEDRDNLRIRQALCELLLPSFYPQDDSQGNGGGSLAALRVERCLAFIEENILAAEAFYSNLHEQVSVGAATKLCVMLISLLIANEKSAEASDENASSSEQNANKGKRSKKRFPAEQSIPIFEDASTKSSARFPAVVANQRTRVGVLRVLLACMQSIYLKLNQVKFSSSLDLFTKHFTAKNMDTILAIYKTSSSSPASVLHAETVSMADEVSIVMKIFALANSVLKKVELAYERSAGTKKSVAKQASPPSAISVEISIDEMLVDLLQLYMSVTETETGSSEYEVSNNSHRLRLRVSLDMIAAMKRETELMTQIVGLFDNISKSLGGSKKKSHGVSTKELSASLVLGVDVLGEILGLTSDDDAFNIESDQLLQLFELMGSVINRAIPVISHSSSMVMQLQFFLAAWTSFAFQELANGRSESIQALVRWTEQIVPSVSSSQAISMMISILLVAADACASKAAASAFDIITNWLEAVQYIIKNPTGKEALSSGMYLRVIEVNIRLATAFAAHGMDDSSETEKMLGTMFDALETATKRYPTQLPANISKALRSLYNRIDKFSVTSEVFQMLKGHNVFVEVA
jgi:hypothetical protein